MVIIFAPKGESLTDNAIRCAKDAAKVLKVGEGVTADGKYDVWQVDTQVFLVTAHCHHTCVGDTPSGCRPTAPSQDKGG